MMRRLVLAAVVPAVTLLSAAAFAQGAAAPTVKDIRAAEEDFNAGREAYRVENYVEAAGFFESADDHAPNPKVLELAIQSRDKAGQIDRAGTLAQLGIERHPENERMQELADKLLVKAKEQSLAVRIQCDEPCSLLEGTRIIHGAAAKERLVYLQPGKHTIRANWSQERGQSQTVDGAAGEERALEFTAPEIPEEPEPEPQPSAPGPRDRGPVEEPSGVTPVVFWAGAGLTVAAAGVSTWSALDTVNDPGTAQVREQCAGQGASCELYQEGQSKQLRTNILWGATGAVGAATVVIGALFTDWSGGEPSSAPVESDSASIRPWIAVGDGAKLGATGRF